MAIGFVGLGFLLAVLSATMAALAGLGFLGILLAYIGGGAAVLLAGLSTSLVGARESGHLQEDPLLLPQEWRA